MAGLCRVVFDDQLRSVRNRGYSRSDIAFLSTATSFRGQLTFKALLCFSPVKTRLLYRRVLPSANFVE